MKTYLPASFTFLMITIFSLHSAIAQRGAGGSSNGTIEVIEQNLSTYPNPAITASNIKYDVPEDGKILLTLYNSLGEKITGLFEGAATRGSYTMKLNTSMLSSGTYICQYILQTGKKQSIVSKKIQISKS